MKKKILATILAVALAVGGIGAIGYFVPGVFAQCIVPTQGALVKTTSYAALAADTGKLLVMNCASNCTLTLPSSPQSPVWTIWVTSIGAGVVTITPNGLTLNGSSNSINVVAGVGEGLMITTDNANYFAASVNVGFYAAGGGTAQAQTLTLNPPIAGYANGLFVAWLPAAANTSGGPTLNVNTLGTKTITKCGTTALVANDLTTTAVAEAIYDGTQFQLLNPQATGCAGAVASAVPVVVDTSTPVTVSTTNVAEYHFNQNGTVGTAITYNLPTAAAGKQFCFSNSYNGTGADTGVLTLQTSASGQYIIYTDGTLSATGGYVSSAGAAADAACVVGVDATHWMFYPTRGAWAKH